MDTQKESNLKKRDKSASFFDYFRFGESYTSLILGILVVIIATGLILGIVHNRNVVNRDAAQPQISQNLIKISQTDTETIISTATSSSKQAPVQAIKPKATPKQQVAMKIAKSTSKFTQKNMDAAKVKPTKAPISKEINPKPTVIAMKVESNKGKEIQTKTYIVKSGDSLWRIAVNQYNDGYKWAEIARTNNLSNPDNIEVGQKLSLPKVEQKKDTGDILADGTSTSFMVENAKIDGSEYKIIYGDSLWTIALRAYGDGYKWAEIARTNNLSNPDLIYPGDKLVIPRK